MCRSWVLRAHFRGFCKIYRKIWGKNEIFKTHFLSSFAVLELEIQFFGYGQPRGVRKICWKRIFEFLIFHEFLARICPDFEKIAIFGPRITNKSAKNEKTSASNKFFPLIIWTTYSQQTGFLALIQKNQIGEGYFKFKNLEIFLWKTQKCARRTQL